MADTPEIRGSQAAVRGSYELSSDLRLSQSFARTLINFPTDFILGSQAATRVVQTRGPLAQVTQGVIRTLVRGAISNPSVRAWTFTLDGHDFYVLKLGNDETLVFDLSTKQWHVWGTENASVWRVATGFNWVGGNVQAASFGSNIVVGSSLNGAVFFLNPEKSTDDAAIAGRTGTPFRRIVTSQIPLRGYDRVSVYEMQLLGSQGELNDSQLTDITLSYSDDRGKTYTSAGVVSVGFDDLDTRATWRSLGSFQSPGRLVRIEDNGALQRIDSLTMNSDLNE
jgi:hypothetical protein